MKETIPDPEEYQPEEDDEETTGATSDPLVEPPGSRGRKAINPYEGTEADDDPGPSLRDVIEDHTPAANEGVTNEQLSENSSSCPAGRYRGRPPEFPWLD